MALTNPIIWHNPRCSKSRETLALLEDRGLTPIIVNYVNAKPTESELRKALQLLNIGPSDLIRKGESLYKEMNLSNADDEALIAAMVANPILIERPVVFANGKAALGRPPESVSAIL